MTESPKKQGFFATSQAATLNGGAKWSCGTCLVSNTDTSEKCVCCATPRPAAVSVTTKQPDETANKVAQVKPLSFGVGVSFGTNGATQAAKWACSTGRVNNEADKLKCVCCQTDKPQSVPKPAVQAAKWTCSTCLVQNEGDKLKCVCCQTEKPVTAQKWACPTCLVSNEGEKLKCVCCQTDKPGADSNKLG